MSTTYEQNEWHEDLENLLKWESSDLLTASDRRILMTWWAGKAYERTCSRVTFNRYFEKTGCLLSVTGDGDNMITPEGLSSFTFERSVIPAVLAEAPVQVNVAPTTHTELQRAAEEEELLEEQELSEEDEGSDEVAKWFIPEWYSAQIDPPAEDLNHAMIDKHLLFKRNGVGWCHGWVSKYYPRHRRGYNFEIVYEDGDRRDHILRLQDYGGGDGVEAGSETCN
ncbi:hypothetical protein CYMTET_31212 [Cymbomonas tetramitiformis]|uniref:Uncharacterized protein n=1 Tax=Cymbomonas tetramitiformis TaxID=36881 RepID=A0AAE0FHD7_9CHLO|nr:hypothetical protein CYMTET_31212 [Cymbomonas tetramitiformis]